MAQIRLNKSSYIHNLNQIVQKVGSKERVILMLKDNAYGHGAVLLGQKASELGFKFCAVKSEREASELECFFDEILILSHIPNGNENQKFIYVPNDINALKELKNGTKIHLGIDTLMHRNGICLDKIDEALEIVKNKNLVLLGAFTHFRSSDEISAEYFVQRQNFKMAKQKVSEFCNKYHLPKPKFHSHNSAGLERFGDLGSEHVRVGITQLGYTQFDESLNLKPVLSLWADRVSSRVLKAGSAVGYGAKFIAKTDINIATYDIGYGDGLFRYDGNGELKLANGEVLLGRMSMDSFSTKDVGKNVCVFDDARVWARHFNTIEYEILVKLSPFIERVWI